MRLPALFIVLLLTQPAHAGAWLREKGTAFLSFAGTIDQEGKGTASIYGEYGLRPKLTIGIAGDASMTAGLLDGGRVFLFLRKPIPTGERRYKLAYEIGVGATQRLETNPLARVGLSYGKGMKIRDKSGWLAIDGAVEWDGEGDQTTVKIDSTLGLNLSDRFKVMMQVFHAQTSDESATTLAPSVIWTPQSGGNSSYQIGLEADGDTVALKLGVWRSF